jgi:hypothetical protein
VALFQQALQLVLQAHVVASPQSRRRCRKKNMHGF